MIIQTDKQILREVDIETILRAHEVDASYKRKLKAYYIGRHRIMNKQARVNTEVNNKIVSNYCAYISNMSTGFFIGKPVTYSMASEKQNQLDTLNEIFRYNDEQTHNLELAEEASITGEAYELLYIDSDANIRFAKIPSEEMIIVVDSTLEQNVLYAIRHYRIMDLDQAGYHEFVDVYDAGEVRRYSYDSGLKLIEESTHYWQDVPVVVYKNNAQGQGDFEDVLTLVDAYNLAQSLTLDDLADFTDAFLVLKNLGGTTPEDAQALRKSKLLLVEENGGAEWLIKNINDTYVENLKTRLQRDIHKFSNIPDMSDESFTGNTSGVAIKYKLIGLEQIRGRKEREFKKSLQRRIELISGMLKLKSKDAIDFRDVEIIFTANIPANLTEQAQLATSLSGMVSQKTLLSLLPFITDPMLELDELAKENNLEGEDYIGGEHSGDGEHDDGEHADNGVEE